MCIRNMGPRRDQLVWLDGRAEVACIAHDTFALHRAALFAGRLSVLGDVPRHNGTSARSVFPLDKEGNQGIRECAQMCVQDGGDAILDQQMQGTRGHVYVA